MAVCSDFKFNVFNNDGNHATAIDLTKPRSLNLESTVGLYNAVLFEGAARFYNRQPLEGPGDSMKAALCLEGVAGLSK